MAESEHHIASLVIQLLPDCYDRIASSLQQQDTADIAAVSNERNKMVVLLELESMAALSERIATIEAYPGVLTAMLVYHHCDSAEALNEEIGHENHAT